MKFKKSERGSALVEHCAVLTVLLPALSALLVLFYLGFAKVWLSNSSDEAAICLSSGETQSNCEQEFRSQIKNVLKFGGLQNLKVSKTENEAHVEVDFAITEKLKLHAEAALALPLKPKLKVSSL